MKYITDICIVIITLCIAQSTLIAQDKHFTQFFGAPLILNPALTGAVDGRFRVSAIYRDQWRNVLEEPYTTFSVASDVRFNLDVNSRYKDAIAIGLVFFTDKVGFVDFTTNQIALSGAFHKGLDWDKKQTLTFGLQGSLNQRNVNYENLTFEDQFNGTTGYTFASGEDLPTNNFSFSDLSVGLNYAYNPKPGMAFIVGGAMHHILEPRISFYDKPGSDDENFGQEGNGVNLHRKYSGYISAELPLGQEGVVSVLPRVLYATQGPHTEITAGTNISFTVDDPGDLALHLGAWFRPVINRESSFEPDAVVALAGLRIKSVLLGFTYDSSLRKIGSLSQRPNAFEISVTYIGDFEDESILCPSF